jgi:hypothetical protein
VPLDVSWAAVYTSPKEAMAAADLAIVGHVVDVVRTEMDRLSPSIPATLYSVDIVKTFKGSASGTIVVKQTGGSIAGKEYVVTGDPMISVGDTAFLFLHRVTGGPYDGTYYVAGGPSGRINVSPSGRLEPMYPGEMLTASDEAGLSAQLQQ